MPHKLILLQKALSRLKSLGLKVLTTGWLNTVSSYKYSLSYELSKVFICRKYKKKDIAVEKHTHVI